MTPELKTILNADCYRYYKTAYSVSHLLAFWLREPMLYHIVIYRKAHYYWLNNSPVRMWWYRMLLNRSQLKTKFQIPYNCEVGVGLCALHIGRIIIAPDASIGSNVDIFTGVTIGKEFRGRRKGSPSIGNNCWIGPNAVIVGNITVGDDVLIAPNAFVNFDVPSHSIVIGNPGKIVHSLDATREYLHNLYKIENGEK